MANTIHTILDTAQTNALKPCFSEKSTKFFVMNPRVLIKYKVYSRAGSNTVQMLNE